VLEGIGEHLYKHRHKIKNKHVYFFLGTKPGRFDIIILNLSKKIRKNIKNSGDFDRSCSLVHLYRFFLFLSTCLLSTAPDDQPHIVPATYNPKDDYDLIK
jgi:hypothetical protein